MASVGMSVSSNTTGHALPPIVTVPLTRPCSRMGRPSTEYTISLVSSRRPGSPWVLHQERDSRFTDAPVSMRHTTRLPSSFPSTSRPDPPLSRRPTTISVRPITSPTLERLDSRVVSSFPTASVRWLAPLE